MIALQPRAAGAYLQSLGPRIDARCGRPRAILIVSAHSLASTPTLLAAPQHAAIYDFGGFDPALYTLRYDAPGAPGLAPRVAELLQAAGLPVQTLPQGGLDHGIWTPLRYLYPQADVPVLPLAWPARWTPKQLFELGRALAPLAGEQVLIVGSGSITHNLAGLVGPGGMPPVDAPATPASTEFRDWFAKQAAAANWPALFDYRAQAPHARQMHPTDEHLLPWFVAAGAGALPAAAECPSDTPRAQQVHASLSYGDIGMDAYAFGDAAATWADTEQAASA